MVLILSLNLLLTYPDFAVIQVRRGISRGEKKNQCVSHLKGKFYQQVNPNQVCASFNRRIRSHRTARHGIPEPLPVHPPESTVMEPNGSRGSFSLEMESPGEPVKPFYNV